MLYINYHPVLEWPILHPQEYADFYIKPLEAKATPDTKPDLKSKDLEVVSESDMVFVSTVYRQLFTTYTVMPWYKGSVSTAPQLSVQHHKETVLQNYQLSSDLANSVAHLFGKVKMMMMIVI